MSKIQIKDISDAEILEAVRAWRRTDPYGPTPDVALASKYPVKVILGKMQQMVDRGILEVGVSLRTAWIVGER